MILKGFRFGMLLQIAIGPICLFIFQTAASYDFITAEICVLGVTIVDFFYIIAAILGIGAIINKYEKAKISMKYFGAFILIFFGISTILGVFGLSIIPSISFLSLQNTKSMFAKTLILTLSNPLTILFWAGVFSTKISEGKMTQTHMYLFGLGAVFSTLFFLSLISVLGNFLNNFLKQDILNILNILIGVILIILGSRYTYKKTL